MRSPFVRRLLRWIGLAVAAILGWRRARELHDEELDPTASDRALALHDPRRLEIPANRAAELIVALLLLGAGGCGAAFFVLLILKVGNSTQWLGFSLGLGFALVAVALVVAGKFVVPQEIAVEEREQLADPPEADKTAALIADGTEGISRRGLLAGAAGVAALGVGGALVASAASLGPNVANRLSASPWRRGVRVLDADGRPILADDIVLGGFIVGYAEGASKRDLATAIVAMRLQPEALHLPHGRMPDVWAPQGIVAYSRICTHAGCAVSLYRYPSYPPTEPRPALICPCHYSTFDVARGADVIFGPAGRSLSQLPLLIDPATNELRANGEFSGSVGPSWFEVDRGGA
jgi:ubiquinol-cytochrome c reductase iron-sulfur subunit